MWELDYKESWVPKNWCFWTVMLEKILESPLDTKEIQPVHPKGDQSWVFIGRTDAEAQAQTLATWFKELTHWKRPCCWERLKVWGEGDDRGWECWMASPTQWTWLWERLRSPAACWSSDRAILCSYQFSSVQSLSRVRLFATPWIAACQASLSITNSRSLLKLMPIETVMPSSHLILCRPLLLLPMPPSIRVFSNESTLCMRWWKYWSFSFSISPSNEYSGLISFRMDWFDLLAIQGTLKSLLQHHSSKAPILQCSAFFIVQLYIHTWLLEKP